MTNPLFPNAPGPPASPLYGQTDPRSAYLAQALQSLGQAAPQGPVAAGSDLLAEALMQYGMNNPRLSGQVQGSQAFSAGANPTAMSTAVGPLQSGFFLGG